jgi:predicted nucleic acid-binding protein
MNQRVHLDANVILRFLRNDDPKQTPAAASLFQKTAGGKVSLFISAVTINEVFFAFTSFYKLTPRAAAETLLQFVRAGAAEFEHETCLIDSLQRVVSENVDFGDAYLAATARSTNDLVASFDHDLRKFKDVKLYDFDSKN